MTLRSYTKADCAPLAQLFYETVHTINARDYCPEQLEAWAAGAGDLEAWDKSFRGHHTLVAELDGTIVGFGDMDETGYLDRLYVHRDYQRRGVATAICDALEGNSKAPAFTTHASITARPFFEGRGYIVLKEQQVERRGVLLTNFIMKKTEKRRQFRMEAIDPSLTKRAKAFELWMKAPMPMVTLMKTLDVTNLLKISRKKGYKFHMLMCWCIGKAASGIEEFYMLPVEDKLMRYDRIAVNTVVATVNGGINTCDVPFSESLEQFNRDYLALTGRVSREDQAYDLGEDYMVIGTSALTQTELDGAVNIYAGFYNNPFVIWGKYRKKLLQTTLPVSFQFHHSQMDGGQAAEFLENLQNTIIQFKVRGNA